MSRVGKQPVLIPQGVEVKLDNGEVFVGGPKGKLHQRFNDLVAVEMSEGKLLVKRLADDSSARAMHGTARSILNNMVEGVTKGFTKSLEI